MKICPLCNSIFPEDYVFCLNDGNTLNDSAGEQETVINDKVRMQAQTVAFTSQSAICASCGAENQADSKFCKKCGTPFSNVFPTNPAPTVVSPFSGFNVPLNSNPPIPNQTPQSGDTILFPIPSPPIPQPPNQPANSNRNIIIAVSVAAAILFAVVGFLVIPKPDRAATEEKHSSPKPNSSSSSSSTSSLPKTFEHDYEGTLGGKSCSMHLKRDNDELSGTVSTSRTDYLYGKINDNGDFELKGYENDTDWTGTYTGTINSDGSIKNGTWTGRKTNATRSFSLTQQ